MKFLLLFCAVVFAHLADSCSKPPNSQNSLPRRPSTATTLSERRDELCDECICGDCRGDSEPLPASAPPCPSVVESKWDLWRSGTCLRGVNTWQKTAGPAGEAAVTYTYKPEDLAELTTSGANYVNLSFPGIYSVKPKGGKYVLEPKVLEELTQLVDRLGRANLFAVVSFRTGPGRSESVFGGEEGEEVVTDVWTSEEARLAWIEMWKEAAGALRDRANVVGYDLMVEPVLDTERVSEESKVPEEAEAGKAENLRRYRRWYGLSKEIAQAIRGAGDTTPILVAGAYAATACSLECLPPLDLPHVVYTVHQYAPYRYTHQVIVKRGKEVGQKSEYDCNNNLKSKVRKPKYVGRPDNTRLRLERIYDLINGYRRAHDRAPVAVNEFGVFRWAPGAVEHLNEETALIERLGANYALWLWEPGGCIGYDEFNFRHGTEYSKHDDVSPNPLTDALKLHWSRNAVFPDKVKFKPPPRDR